MDKKELIVTGMVIIIAVVAAGIIFAPSISANDTSIEILNKGDLGGNSTIYVKLADGDKISLSNKTIHIKLTDEKNNVVYEDSVKTKATGVAIVKLHNISAGQYNLDVKYDGDENYTGCSISQKVTVKQGEVQDVVENSTLIQQTLADSQDDSSSQSSSSSSSSYYTPSSSSSSSSRSSSSSSSSSQDSSSHYYDVDGNEVLPEYDADGRQVN